MLSRLRLPNGRRVVLGVLAGKPYSNYSLTPFALLKYGQGLPAENCWGHPGNVACLG